MKGYLLIYNTKNNKDAVNLNHKLLGRIISVPRNGVTNRYYSGGALDKIPYKRLKEGCYFSKRDVNLGRDDLVKMKADLQIQETELNTGRGYWKNHARKKKIEVKNL